MNPMYHPSSPACLLSNQNLFNSPEGNLAPPLDHKPDRKRKTVSIFGEHID